MGSVYQAAIRFIHRLSILARGQRTVDKGLSRHISWLACQICNPSRVCPLQNKSNTESLRFPHTEKVSFVRQLSEDTAEQISALHPQRPETGDIYDTKKRSGLRRLERHWKLGKCEVIHFCRPMFRVSGLN